MGKAGRSYLSKLPIVISWVALFCALDLGLKFVVTEHVMDPPRVITVTPFFNIILTYNPGVSFGMFSESIGSSPYFFGALQAIIVLGLVVWSLRARLRIESFAIASIAGGAAGNILDRFWNRAVTDYLDFHAFGWSWPAFNLADVMIVCGAFLVVLVSGRTAKDATNVAHP